MQTITWIWNISLGGPFLLPDTTSLLNTTLSLLLPPLSSPQQMQLCNDYWVYFPISYICKSRTGEPTCHYPKAEPRQSFHYLFSRLVFLKEKKIWFGSVWISILMKTLSMSSKWKILRFSTKCVMKLHLILQNCVHLGVGERWENIYFPFFL